MRNVAVGVHSYIGERILSFFILIRGIAEVAVLLKGYLATGGFVNQLEGDKIPFWVHGGTLAVDGHIFVGGKFKIFRNRSRVGGLGGSGRDSCHRQAQRPQQAHGQKRDSVFQGESLLLNMVKIAFSK